MKAKPAALEPDLRHARWISKGLPVSITTSNIAAASAWFSHYASSLLFSLLSFFQENFSRRLNNFLHQQLGSIYFIPPLNLTLFLITNPDTP